MVVNYLLTNRKFKCHWFWLNHCQAFHNLTFDYVNSFFRGTDKSSVHGPLYVELLLQGLRVALNQGVRSTTLVDEHLVTLQVFGRTGGSLVWLSTVPTKAGRISDPITYHNNVQLVTIGEDGIHWALHLPPHPADREDMTSITMDVHSHVDGAWGGITQFRRMVW